MYGVLLFFHLLGATIWTGGHIVLSVVVLPKVLRERSPEQLLNFESVFEKIGMPALIVQVITGIMLTRRYIPEIDGWFDFTHPAAHAIGLKLALLLLTFGFALDAKLRVIPHLSPDNLRDMAWHIVPVTLFSVLFVFAGVSFRTGWLF